jgi:hypothetical protein
MRSLPRCGLSFVWIVGLIALVGCQGEKGVDVQEWYVTTDPIPTYQGTYKLPTDEGPKVWVVFYAQFPVDKLWVEMNHGTKYHWAPEDFKLVTADGQEFAAKYGDADGKFGIGGVFLDEPGETNSRIGIAIPADEKAVQAGPLKVKYRDLAEFDLPTEKKGDAPAQGERAAGPTPETRLAGEKGPPGKKEAAKD